MILHNNIIDLTFFTCCPLTILSNTYLGTENFIPEYLSFIRKKLELYFDCLFDL